jgi:hypothetical protein
VTPAGLVTLRNIEDRLLRLAERYEMMLRARFEALREVATTFRRVRSARLRGLLLPSAKDAAVIQTLRDLRDDLKAWRRDNS